MKSSRATASAFEQSLGYLSSELVERFDALIRGYAPPRLETALARPFVRALLPLAISSRVWRSGRLDGASGIFGVDSSVAASAISMSAVATRTPMPFDMSPGGIQLLGNRLTGRRQGFRLGAVNVGRPGVVLAAPNEMLRLLTTTTGNLRRKAGQFPFGTALASAFATILIHPFSDGNGRTARTLSYVLCRSALGRNHVPMSIPFITQPAMNLLRILDAAVAGRDFSLLEKLVDRCARSWGDLCACVAEQVNDYEACCRAEFGRDFQRCLCALVGQIQIPDRRFTRSVRALRCVDDRRGVEAMFTVALINGETTWINRSVLSRLDNANKFIYRTL
jgi:hypothetical protein